jgi:hypothetical protein
MYYVFIIRGGDAVAYLVEALCYKPEGPDEVDFFNFTQSFQPH